MDDRHQGRTARPEDWPEMFAKPEVGCNHQYHWDDAEGVYRCMHCDDTREEPK